MGRTGVVKHSIPTPGHPIQQSLHRVPASLKGVVHDEVRKMMEQGIIHESNSRPLVPVVDWNALKTVVNC